MKTELALDGKPRPRLWAAKSRMPSVVSRLDA